MINKNNNSNNKKNKVISSDSNSSLSSSSPILCLTPRRSMEEVWKDINLSSLHNEIPATPPLSLQHHHLPRTSNHPSSAGVILQDFLAGSFKEGPPPPPLLPHSSNPCHLPIDLNLESSSFHLDPNSHVISSSPQLGFCSRKRLVEQQMSDGFCGGNDGSCDDRRQKKMIKNRESASRSRARKQAYTNELELEVAHLVQENAKLRKQCDELRSAMAAQIPVKRTLQRASSSPF